ncbi:phosphatase [uncultured Clostridium sp.]|uniref:phosphatase n=1 Tax=uncultured Clostridium sp. TaxID=59620 RepID=UPI0025DE8DDC|nr:phosphatase [uncultured Clostridium sp.]
MKENALELRKEYMRSYMKKWRAKNKDKVKASNERYWEKKATEAKQQLEEALKVE